MGFRVKLHSSNRAVRMSALGQKRTFCDAEAMSALPPKADIVERDCHVRFVPKADISNSSAERTPMVLDLRITDFVKAGKIRAGLAEAPIIATKDLTTGELRGVAVDLSRELAARIGVELVQVRYPRPGAVMAGLKSNDWDIAFLGVDPRRAAEAEFSPPYLEVDWKYLVQANSPIRRPSDVDTAGIRIAVPRGDLVDIVLGEKLQQAELVRADTVVGAFDLLQIGRAEVCALPLPNLLQYSPRLPGSRILDEPFGINRVGMVVPKGQTAHLAYISEFIESAKASGFVQRAIERAGLRGVRVAPAANTGTES